MEESSLNVKINQSIQNKVSIICEACRCEGNRFSFPKLPSVKYWGESGVGMGGWRPLPSNPQSYYADVRRQGGTNFLHFSGTFSYWN